MSFISSEYIFSDWIFVWFILYFILTKMIQNESFEKYFNPTLALSMALFQNIATFIYLIWKNPKLNILIKFSLMMICEKMIPLLLLFQNDKSLHFQNNIPVTLGIFGLYVGFLFSKNRDFFHTYEQILHSILMDDNNVPFFWFIHKYLGI